MIRYLIFCFCLFTSSISSQSSIIDSLKWIIDNQSDTTAVLAGYELGKRYVRVHADSALLIFQKSLKLAEKIDFHTGQMKLYRGIGATSLYTGDIELSIDASKRGIEIIDKHGLSIENKVDLLINYGAAKSYSGKLGESIDIYTEAVEICRENGFKSRHSKLLNNLGIFYRRLGEYENAVDIYNRAYSLKEESKDTLGMANVLYNKTAVYAKLQNSEKALISIDKALALFQYLKIEEDIELCKLSKGMALNDLNRIDEALALIFPLADKKKKFKDPINTYSMYLLLGKIYLHKKECDQVLYYINFIKKDLIIADYIEQQKSMFQIESQAYACLGKMEKAYQSLLSYNDIMTKVHNQDEKSFEEEMLTKYETAEKDYKIELLNNEKQISELKLKSTKTRNKNLVLWLGGLGLFSLILIGLYRKLVTQNVKLEKSEKDKSLLLREIHHRVKNNLQVISSLLSLQARKISDPNTIDALNASKSRVQSMSLLHRNLYNNDDLKGINTDDYFNNLVQNIADIYKVDDNVSFEIDIQPITIDIDMLTPLGLIANELICNALKHGLVEGDHLDIYVKLKRVDQTVQLHVQDNGVGLPNDQFIDVSTSIGVKLIKTLTKSLNGEIIITPGGGADILIVIPEKELGK